MYKYYIFFKLRNSKKAVRLKILTCSFFYYYSNIFLRFFKSSHGYFAKKNHIFPQEDM